MVKHVFWIFQLIFDATFLPPLFRMLIALFAHWLWFSVLTVEQANASSSLSVVSCPWESHGKKYFIILGKKMKVALSGTRNNTNNLPHRIEPNQTLWTWTEQSCLVPNNFLPVDGKTITTTLFSDLSTTFVANSFSSEAALLQAFASFVRQHFYVNEC